MQSPQYSQPKDKYFALPAGCEDRGSTLAFLLPRVAGTSRIHIPTRRELSPVILVIALIITALMGSPLVRLIAVFLTVPLIVFIVWFVATRFRLPKGSHVTIEVATPVGYVGEELDLLIINRSSTAIEHVDLVCEEAIEVEVPETNGLSYDNYTHTPVRSVPIALATPALKHATTPGKVRVPADAMHSFVAPHARINWMVSVEFAGQDALTPPTKFHLTVLPKRLP